MESSQAILDNLQHLALLTHRQSDQVLQEQLGIGMSQYRILQALQSNPAVQQKHLATRLGQTEASISRQIKLMQDRSMVSVQVNPDNKREHQTALLLKGQRLLQEGTQVLARCHYPALQSLSASEQSKLLQLLTKLYAAVV